MMKIYFAGSIRGGREDEEIYQKLVIYLRKYGSVLTEHVAFFEVQREISENITEDEIYLKAINSLDACDCIVAEVTRPSLGVGFEIGYCIAKNKKIICLYNSTKAIHQLSAMIKGSSLINLCQYSNLFDAYKSIDFYLSKWKYDLKT